MSREAWSLNVPDSHNDCDYSSQKKPMLAVNITRSFVFPFLQFAADEMDPR